MPYTCVWEFVDLCLIYVVFYLYHILVVLHSCLIYLCRIFVSELIVFHRGEAADDFERTAWMHYNAFWELREHFRTEGTQLFVLTQKAHSAMHAALLCRCLNPRFSWCYRAESWMGVARTLALSCSQASGNGRGVEATRLLLAKWRLAMHYTLQNPDMWVWRTRR